MLCISAFEQARVLILGKYVLLGVIDTIYKHGHAWLILWNAAEKEIVQVRTCSSSFKWM